MSKKQKNLIMILIFILIVGVLLIYLSTKPFEKEEKENEEPSEDEPIEEVDPDSDIRNYNLNIYSDNNNNICLKYSTMCRNLYLVVKTETPDAEILALSGNDYLLVDDAGLEIVDLKSKKITRLRVENLYDDYTIQLYNDKPFGITCYTLHNADRLVAMYYNISENKQMYKNEFTDIGIIDEENLYGINDNDDKIYLLNSKSEGVLFEAEMSSELKENIDWLNLEIVDNGTDKIIIANMNTYSEVIMMDVYTYDGKFISRGGSDGDLSVSKKYIYKLKDNQVTTYDFKGNQIKTMNVSMTESSVVYGTDYVVGLKKLALSAINLETGEEVGIMDLGSNYTYEGVRYSKNDLVTSDKREGIYFLVKDTKTANEGYIIYFNPETKEYKTELTRDIGKYLEP